MRSTIIIAVAAIIFLGFAAFSFTWTLDFAQVGVVSTFGDAAEESVVREPGLKTRWPAPVQSVTVYDTRARLLRARSETQQTADNRQIVVESFLTWRVSNPLRFFQRFSGEGAEESMHFAAAERTLQSQLRSAMSEVSRYELVELFTTELAESKLPELEQRVLQRLSDIAGENATISDWGIEPLVVGVSRVVLPEETTQDVFERMKATQQRLAAEAESRGESLANTIRTAAESDASRILSFAEARAAEIRNRGDEEATRFLATLNEAPDLAVFLEQLEFMRNLYGRRATLVLDTTVPGMSVFDPGVLGALAPSGLPPFAMPEREDSESPEDAPSRREGDPR